MLLSFFRTKAFLVAVFFASAAVYISTVAVGNPNGIIGRSKSGCGGNGCHGTGATAATIVTISTTATEIVAGQTYPFTITVKNPTTTLIAGGCDLSVAKGKFKTGPGLQLFNGKELTQTSPRAFAGDSVTWTFSYIAPTTPGTDQIFAAGNAVNGNGSNDANDKWNVTTYNITVVAGAPKPILGAPTAITLKSPVEVALYQRVSLKNTGTAVLNIFGYTLGASSDITFSDTTQHTIAVGDSVGLAVTFTPSAHATVLDTIRIFNDGAVTGGVTSIAINARGTQGLLTLLPSSPNFGNVELTKTKTLSFAIRNTGDGPVIFRRFNLVNTTDFRLVSVVPNVTLPDTLKASDSVVVTLSSSPKALGPLSTMFEFTYSQFSEPTQDSQIVVTTNGVPLSGVDDEKAIAATFAITVVPSPSIGQQAITLRTQKEITGHISMIDANGRIVRDFGVQHVTAKLSLPLSGIASGSYFVRVASDNGDIRLARIVIER